MTQFHYRNINCKYDPADYRGPPKPIFNLHTSRSSMVYKKEGIRCKFCCTLNEVLIFEGTIVTRPADDEIPTGLAPSKMEEKYFQNEEDFYLQWEREGVKNSIALANDILKQLVTLNTALLGGSVVFLDDSMMNPIVRTFVIILFFTALVTSFLGMIPHRTPLSRDLVKIEGHKAAALDHKDTYLWLASSCTAPGFAVAIAGLLYRLWLLAFAGRM